MFLGFTGPNAAGKGEAIKYLVDNHRFTAFSLSDILRNELKNRSVEINRDNLISLGNELRAKDGPAVLAKMTSMKIKNMPQAVIDSIRNPSEIEELRKNLKNFILIGVTADIKARYERAKSRAREGEAFISFEEFKAKEAKENSNDPNAQQLNKCFESADIKLDNSGDIKDLYASLDRILKEKNYVPYTRPSWTEYFMKMAYLAAERSTCIRHHVGAVIVKNNKVVSTGYNGAAAGVKDCTELGCLRDQMGIASGTRHEICRAIHAEQNAIIQAALNGTSTEGATMYSTHSPCVICAKMVVNAKIKKFVTSNYYPDKTYEELFKEAGVEFTTVNRPPLTINFLD
jgi:dCMP deaminase